MKAKIIDMTGKESGSVSLPAQFAEEIRPDLVKRAVLCIQANNRQRYGADPEAGKCHVTKLSRRRRKYMGSYGMGISRVPRKILSRNGTQANWVGAFAPGTVGGRRAHPPKADKIWSQKINTKENRKAIRSAISAAAQKELVEERGHMLPATYPFIIDDKFEELASTKQVQEALLKLGLDKELDRASEKKIRAGRGKMRGRRYKKRIGPLIVVSKTCKLAKSAGNIPGMDVVNVKQLNAEDLAPGAQIGRLTIWTKGALEKLEKDKLFM